MLLNHRGEFHDAGRDQALIIKAGQPQSRIGWMVTGTLFLVSVGSAVGWLGADYLHDREAKAELQQSANRVLDRLDEIIAEAGEVFSRLNQLEQAHCSDDMLLVMRSQLFEARFIKDIGGIRNHNLHCSTALGRLSQPLISGPPDVSLPGGIGLRTDRSVLAARAVRTMVIEHRWFNVLVDPRLVTDLTASQAEGEIFLRPASGSERPWHAFQHAGAERLELLDGSQRRGLTTSVCSELSGLCVLLHHPQEVKRAGQAETQLVITSLGGMLGLAVFLAGLFVVRQRQTPEYALRRAIRQGNIKAVYQPIISLPGQQAHGFEALARWVDEDGPTLSPETFISLAEQTNQIEQISSLMISQIGRELGGWLAESAERCIAINIAPKELLGPGLVSKLEQNLICRGVKPGQILLEITERTMVSGQAAAEAIEALSRRGFRVFADDFGVGYCGLGYLNELHMDGIKISQSFTAALGTDSPKAALVPRIIELARELNLEIIVEGVETEAQLQALTGMGPLLVQGWLLAREIPARQLLEQYDTLLPVTT